MKSIVLAAALVICPVILFAQNTPARQSPAPTAAPGRFQLVPDNRGAMFLVDSATGRVWRFAELVMDENDPEIKKTIDQRFDSRRNQRLPDGRMPTLDELRKIVTEEIRQEYAARNSPCHGTKACFLEVDRAQLTQQGWTSEVVAK